jgi:hypothetical protein
MAQISPTVTKDEVGKDASDGSEKAVSLPFHWIFWTQHQVDIHHQRRLAN